MLNNVLIPVDVHAGLAVSFWAIISILLLFLLKRMAKPYQEAKSMLRAYLLQQGFGPWPVKVSVSDNFGV